MKIALLAAAALSISAAAPAADSAITAARPDWPMLKTYSGDDLSRVKMPIGGVGTGTISLSGLGGLVDWEIRNHPDKGYEPNYHGPFFLPRSFFAIRVKPKDGKPVAKLLEGPLPVEAYTTGDNGCFYHNRSFPRFRECSFSAAFPLAQVSLSDPDVPVRVTLQAFNPLVPGDTEASSMPVVMMNWRIENATDSEQEIALCGSLVNPAKVKGTEERIESGDLKGVALRAPAEGDEKDFETGDLAMFASGGEIMRLVNSRERRSWGTGDGDFWERFALQGDFAEDGSGPENGRRIYRAYLGVKAVLQPHASVDIPFAIAWRFPVRYGWKADGERFENWYARRWPSAEAAAAEAMQRRDELEAATVNFVKSVLGASVPKAVKEAALFNLVVLKSTTCFRLADGTFWGWEGSFNKHGSCAGNCSHVWGYEHALIDLWPDLAKSMLETWFGAAQREDGGIRFRTPLPAKKAEADAQVAADGHLECILKFHRAWKERFGNEFLQAHWPAVRKAVEFCWIPGGWDADCDGVMEGCQHNTMDVEYYGPNPQMGFLYVAALKAAAAMADAMGEGDFAAKCRGLSEKGSAFISSKLFNGRYFHQEVRASATAPAKGLKNSDVDPAAPTRQMGGGCVSDQLLGVYVAEMCGVEGVGDDAQVRTALKSILSLNRKEGEVFDYDTGRGYVFPGERGVKLASFPEGTRPDTPFPYHCECWTGVEYMLAALSAMRGDTGDAAEIVRDVRARFDGSRRNPFNEPECGHHYTRSLASWSVFKALSRETGRRGWTLFGDKVLLNANRFGVNRRNFLTAVQSNDFTAVFERTEHCTMARITLPKTDEPRIQIDYGYGFGEGSETQLHSDMSQSVGGWTKTADGRRTYFATRFSVGPARCGMWNGPWHSAYCHDVSGSGSTGYFHENYYAKEGDEIVVRTAISEKSVDEARAFLDAEMPEPPLKTRRVGRTLPPVTCAPKPKANPTAKAIQRTMKALEESTAENPATVRLLFYGQSITAQWGDLLALSLRERYPTANIEWRNEAIGGYGTGDLWKMFERDVPAFYPDIVFFHDYGDVEKGYPRFLEAIRSRTTAEIVLWSSHFRRLEDADRVMDLLAGGSVKTKSDTYYNLPAANRTTQIRAVSEKFGTMFIDLQKKWYDTLAMNGWKVGDLLRDTIHLSPAGCSYYHQFIDEEIVRVPGEDGDESVCGTIREMPYAPEFEFSGNRVVAVSDGTGDDGASFEILLDGKPIAEVATSNMWAMTRPSSVMMWLPALKGVGLGDTLPQDEFWKMTILEDDPDAQRYTLEKWKRYGKKAKTMKPLRYKVEGSATGFDGEGSSDTTFVSASGRVRIPPEAFDDYFSYQKLRPAPGREIRWRTYPLFATRYAPTVKGARTVIVQGCENGRHTLSFRGKGNPGISKLIVHEPARQPEDRP